jgi:protein TonB
MIDEYGRVCDIVVLRGVDPALDAEAVRVVSSSPRWTPGYMGGKPVRVTYTFPVIFQLQ